MLPPLAVDSALISSNQEFHLALVSAFRKKNMNYPSSPAAYTGMAWYGAPLSEEILPFHPSAIEAQYWI